MPTTIHRKKNCLKRQQVLTCFCPSLVGISCFLRMPSRTDLFHMFRLFTALLVPWFRSLVQRLRWSQQHALLIECTPPFDLDLESHSVHRNEHRHRLSAPFSSVTDPPASTIPAPVWRSFFPGASGRKTLGMTIEVRPDQVDLVELNTGGKSLRMRIDKLLGLTKLLGFKYTRNHSKYLSESKPEASSAAEMSRSELLHADTNI